MTRYDGMSNLEGKGQEVRKQINAMFISKKTCKLLGNPHAHFLQEAVLDSPTQSSWSLHLLKPQIHPV